MRIEYAILRLASRIVPGSLRAEWFAEWNGELSYVFRASRRSALAFTLGAFPDAVWIRRNHPRAAGRKWLQSPLECAAVLGALAALTVVCALQMPAARRALLPSPYPDARNLAMVSRIGAASSTVTIEDYHSLKSHTPAAFYQPRQGRINGVSVAVAFATANLFDLLGMPVPGPPYESPVLFLSEKAWRGHFKHDSQIVGRVFSIDGKPARVAGIVPPEFWRLPGNVDAWLVGAALRLDATGFAVVRGVFNGDGPRQWRIVLPNRHGGRDAFRFVSLDTRQSLLIHIGMLGLALLILPVATTLHLGEYPSGVAFRRWLFLGGKVALLIVIVFCGSLGAAAGIGAAPVQAHGLLVGYIFAFRWALRDQRSRCPVCLRRLTNPAAIGRPSQTLLEWYGTELICPQGHGLLHVPEIPAGSFGVQSWMRLDPSWKSLFVQPGAR